PTCTDGVKNQDETGVDCGGAICSKICLPQQGCHTFADEFNQDGKIDMSKWEFGVGGDGWGNEEKQYYTSSRLKNARCENGQLIIEAHKENYEDNQFTSAKLISKQAFLYGRLQGKDAKEGTVMAEGNGEGGNLTQLSSPAGMIVDYLGQIYVADCGNDRIMRWCEGKSEGEIVIGGNGKGNEPNQLNQPKGLSFDDGGNLYVVDLGNNRIVKFEIIL
ncbi:unnamed protein product, partial [Adineta steineri]